MSDDQMDTRRFFGMEKRRMENIKELAAALTKAQAKIEGATKDKLNPHFKSKYADLASVVEAIKKPLSEHGLAYIQILHDAENAAKVETVILHSSGEHLSCGTISVPVSKSDAQGLGSALTYARRYSLSAAFGVAPEDDDGNAAAAAAPRPYAAAHSPTDGSVDALEPADQATARKIANTLVDLWGLDTEKAREDAYAAYYETNLSNEMKLAVWEILRPHSSLRSRLKRMYEEKKAKNVTTMAR